MRLTDVTEQDLGIWIGGGSYVSPTWQNLEIIKLAIKYGWQDYDMEAWQEMYDLHIWATPEPPTYSDTEDLAWILDDAVEYLTSQLPAGYYFTFEDTNFILTHEDYEENK